MKLKIQSFIVFCMITSLSFAQIGIGTTSPDASSVLDMTSTTQGVLIPRMTTEEKEEALSGPARVAGATISENLNKLINKHLQEYDISLPVFQHALMRTWDYWLENAEYGKPVDVEVKVVPPFVDL